MILPPNADVKPLAVMIESVYASIARVAMTTTWQCDHCTLWANLTHVKLFEKVHQLNRGVSCDVTRSDKYDHWT